MARVVAGVLFHPFGERTARPIHFLRAFLELDAEMPFHQRAEAELFVTEQTGGGHGVEDFAGDEMERFTEHAQVVVRAMKDQLAITERVEQVGEVEPGERIDQKIACFEAKLQEAELLGIGVKTIGFGINRNPGRSLDCCDNRIQILRIRDHPTQNSVNSGILEACRRE